MNEAEERLYSQLISKGYKVYHKGFPDFLVSDGKRAAFVEVKGPGDTLSPLQYEAMEILTNSGIHCSISENGYNICPFVGSEMPHRIKQINSADVKSFQQKVIERVLTILKANTRVTRTLLKNNVGYGVEAGQLTEALNELILDGKVLKTVENTKGRKRTVYVMQKEEN